MKKMLLIAAGYLSLILGVIGVVLPVLPTTPFLLLSGYCFARSSKKFELWLKQTKLYQFYVADYAESKSIAKERKKKIIVQIYLLMGLSVWLAPIIWVKIALLALTVFITYYLFGVIPDR
ncbi:YbaN family protein [Streptococcus sp. H31]|uniref:YbaN family protein n=1 Tax=Streptococcus huangxiaojuni TaxID=3237239 RepID=UPI0034A47B1D